MLSRRHAALVVLVFSTGIAGCAWLRPDLAARVATGTTAHDICSETFVSGLDPQRVYAESLAPRPGYRTIAAAIRWQVDRERGRVQASLAGLFASTAVYRGAWGCALAYDDAAGLQADAPRPPALPAAAEAPLAPPATPGLAAVMDQAFAEADAAAPRATKAVLVMHRGRLVAERYAPGWGPQTPVLGFSLTKSVMNALVGILVQQGKLRRDQTVPLPTQDEPARSVSLEQLMRMSSGLDLDETGSGFDASNHMLYAQRDMAAFAGRAAQRAPAGERWFYSSASTHLVARVVRDAVGGNAESVQRFAQDALFQPLGMNRVTLEMDATGTPVGVHYMLASPRDWMRLGALYLDDGLADGRRLLPEGWVAWSATPTLDTSYGAGWWVNRRTRNPPPGRPMVGMPLMPDVPSDAFYGLGNLGQYIVVVPSAQLVVVRLGRAHTPNFDLQGMNRLIAGLIAELR